MLKAAAPQLSPAMDAFSKSASTSEFWEGLLREKGQLGKEQGAWYMVNVETVGRFQPSASLKKVEGCSMWCS